MTNGVRPSTDRKREARLELRDTGEHEELIHGTGEAARRSVANYVIASPRKPPRDTRDAHETIALSAADSRAFVAAPLDPPPVNRRLKESVRIYLAATGA
jgi:uncharacterized protein (DUF1778 family)